MSQIAAAGSGRCHKLPLALRLSSGLHQLLLQILCLLLQRLLIHRFALRLLGSGLQVRLDIRDRLLQLPECRFQAFPALTDIVKLTQRILAALLLARGKNPMLAQRFRALALKACQLS